MPYIAYDNHLAPIMYKPKPRGFGYTNGMTQETQHILLIPGLYPRGCEAIQKYAYSSVIPSWQKDGFSVTVQQFGWDDYMPLEDRQQALLETIDDMPDNLYVIGASAGGLAVINALRERPEKINKVLTVATPLNLAEADLAHFKDNPFVPIPALLRAAYYQADNFLNSLGSEELTRIISLHGTSDPRVRPPWSQRPGIANYALPTRGHARTIMGALRRYRQETQELLAK